MDVTIARPSILRRLTQRPRPLGALSASALIAVGSLVPSLQQCAPPSQQQQVVDVTNQRRAEYGRPAVRVSSALSTAAQRHSEWQARNATMSHTGSGGSSAGQRIAATGYQACAWAENVAAGQPDAQRVMGSWMNSSGHRANILGNYRDIGVGLAYSAGGTPYWTMVLATSC